MRIITVDPIEPRYTDIASRATRGDEPINDGNWNVFWLAKTAHVACESCRSTGLDVINHHTTPCPCVLRAVFGACLEHYRTISELQDARSTRVHVSDTLAYSRPEEEWLADFAKIVKRELDENEQRLLIEYMKGNIPGYVDQIKSIQEILGLAFLETKPHALFPLHKYFGKAGQK